MRYYETIAEFERGGFEIIVDRTGEDIDPWSQLNECFDSREQLYADIDSGKYEWFMLRTRAFLKGREMASTYLGGCLYERAEDVMTDGTVEDQLITLIAEARAESKLFSDLLNKMLAVEAV